MGSRFFLVTGLAAATCLSACGGGGDGGRVISPPPPTADPQVTVQQVFPQLSFARPVVLTQAPNDSTRWFAVEQAGVIRSFANDQSASTSAVFLDIQARVVFQGTQGDERGLLGMAFHPDFPNTAEVFASYTGSLGGLTSFVSRFRSIDGGRTLDPTSEEVLLSVPQPFTNHNGGQVLFGPDGLLYIGFGDGGGSGDPQNNAQITTNLLGAMLRIDVDGSAPYGIPSDNPFASPQLCLQGIGGGNCPEIFAWGFRNPWRFSFDRANGNLWVGDVGQGSWEEIDLVAVGENYGWRVREGAHCFDPPSGCATAGLVDPVIEYGRDLGQSVTGGYVYRGSAMSDLVGWYLFADFVQGRIFGIPADSSPGVTPTEFDDTSLSIASFAEDADGELYVVDYATGGIYQIVAAP